MYILPFAFILDLILGDPQFAHHPIRHMGKAIEILEPRFRKSRMPPIISGAFFAVFLICSTWGLISVLTAMAHGIHPILGTMLEIVLIYFCISAHALEEAAMEVWHSLSRNDLREAKDRLALIVGRDVRELSESGVAGAAVETVAENLSDGLIAPLFFAALGGAPLVMAYKMINTLDSMIGYKNKKYEDFGKVAARTDDVANFVPARVSVPVISLAAQLLSARGVQAFQTARKEGARHSSPNAGYPEAAFAGALGVRLGGPNHYHGQLISKPHIGTKFGEVQPGHIRKACDLMLLSSFLWLLILTAAGFFDIC
ncbi:MAG: cobalamin biosynthesis protein CobD [Desulfobacteraceae bacterium 4572_88]|nr:MAG: cobalamin biosynthesis protein CobD [Desulfobacteraceae bacterium 4572_88]